jgi:cytoskeletal protein RodZ
MAKTTGAKRSKYTALNLEHRRVDSGLSLEYIADCTKISMRFLRAIEDEEFEKLPGGVYDRSYIRQYAAAIGFDEARLLEYYSRMTEPERKSEIVVPRRGGGFRRWFREMATGR